MPTVLFRAILTASLVICSAVAFAEFAHDWLGRPNLRDLDSKSD